MRFSSASFRLPFQSQNPTENTVKLTQEAAITILAQEAERTGLPGWTWDTKWRVWENSFGELNAYGEPRCIGCVALMTHDGSWQAGFNGKPIANATTSLEAMAIVNEYARERGFNVQ
jgi:hypothetical protein